MQVKKSHPHVEHDDGTLVKVLPRRPHRRSFLIREPAELAKNYGRQEAAQRLELACFCLVGLQKMNVIVTKVTE